ncbi:MAG: translation elongation factor Ts, partial [Rivularia sp. (in: cyanobacteria)]
IAGATKKSDRIAAEGLIDTYIDPNSQVGVLIEVNCQTDFVARNDAFKALVQNLAKQAATVDGIEALLSQPYAEDKDKTVEQSITETIAQLGENIKVRRFENYSASANNGVVDSYIHTGGRVGVLVEVKCASDKAAGNEEVQTLARNVAMQVAACPNVEYVNVNEIPAEISAKEKEIEMGRDDLAKKPDNIKEKIVQGRIDKRLKEMTLLDQPYIRDQSTSIEELVKQTGSKVGEEISISRFTRYILGEGIDKKEEDFASEVAAQMGNK